MSVGELLQNEEVLQFLGAMVGVTVMYTVIGRLVDPSRGRYDRCAKPYIPSRWVVAVAVLVALYSTRISGTPAVQELLCGGECAASDVKPYTTFHDFYYGEYIAEHQVRADRAMHVIVFLSTMVILCSNRSLLLTWSVMMAAGAIITPALLFVSAPFVEAAVMFAVAAVVAMRLDVHGPFFLLANLWLLGDLASHVFLGKNGLAALEIGKHYLSWGLWGQCKLVLDILMSGDVAP